MLTPSIPGKGGAFWLLDQPEQGAGGAGDEDVTVPGFITNGAKLGMQVGDIVWIRYGGRYMGLPASVLSVTPSSYNSDGPATLGF